MSVLTAKGIADDWLIKNFSSDEDRKEMAEQIIKYAKQKCEQQRAVCSQNWLEKTNKVTSTDEKLKLILDAPEPENFE